MSAILESRSLGRGPHICGHTSGQGWRVIAPFGTRPILPYVPSSTTPVDMACGILEAETGRGGLDASQPGHGLLFSRDNRHENLDRLFQIECTGNPKWPRAGGNFIILKSHSSFRVLCNNRTSTSLNHLVGI
jgi:hypothetical protein